MHRRSATAISFILLGAFFLTLALAGPAAAQDGEPSKSRKSSKSGSSKSTKDASPGRDKVEMSDIPADTAAEKKALKELGNEAFKLKRTMHYSVVYNTSDEDVRTFGLAIEQTYRSCIKYTQKLGFDAHAPKKKLIIYYFEEHGDYNGHSKKVGVGEMPQSTPGVYVPELNISMFYNFRNQDSFKKARQDAEAKIDQLKGRLKQGNLTPQERRQINQEIKNARSHANWSTTIGGDVSESIVQHEVAHQVLWNIGFHNPKVFIANPRWFAEGTAMMFEPISTGTSANFGALNSDRLKEYQALEQAKGLVPVKEFISHAGWFGPATIGQAYAQSWALVHYLNRAKRNQVKAYVEIINKRPKTYKSTPEQEIKDFETAFGKLDRKWEDAWKSWMKRVR
ncbi:MAG TPA: DUF1570 domain-containing protein [Phycisphaerae bacterium]|nr:DUF1570 domain-containing protein [Phycisphaerae bacterium]